MKEHGIGRAGAWNSYVQLSTKEHHWVGLAKRDGFGDFVAFSFFLSFWCVGFPTQPLLVR